MWIRRFTPHATHADWTVFEGGETVCYVLDPEKARLITAAPDLLAALKKVADYWAGGDVPPEIDALMRAAIARATSKD
jgi:hypothetical protein